MITLFPAYVFFSTMNSIAKRWRRLSINSKYHGLIVLRFAQILLAGSTILFLCSFVDSLHSRYPAEGNLGCIMIIWILMGIVVLPTLLISLLIHYTHFPRFRRKRKNAST
jgi:hypothetical protein